MSFKSKRRDSSPDVESQKGKRVKFSSDEEEERRNSGSKMGNGVRSPSFINHNKPAELFRKDLISAMKLADSDQLSTEEYCPIVDPWRQEWEKGVQVPVNPGAIPEISIRVVREKEKNGDFKIPRKMLHAVQDETYRQGMHELSGMQQLSEQVVRYDLDDVDVCWLERVNEEREEMGDSMIHEWVMERIIEELENQCHECMQRIIKTEVGLGIEYDEDVICDVCRSPDSEENNEMVFCDGCDICVHQACYGIQTIPEGSWLCRTCALGIKPTCILCPSSTGAMKSTRSGTKWAHVSCALWIPEVSIGYVEKMEPITKISQIPPSRWALVCCLCKERVGACIQCSVKTCKTAFHVTCAFQNNLEMKTILDESDEEDGVKLKAYCPKHSKKRDRSQSDSEQDSPRKEFTCSRKELSNEEKANMRAQRLKQLEEDFYTLVDVVEISKTLEVTEDVGDMVFTYWKLKRKANFDKPLLTPKQDEANFLEKQQEDSLAARMKMFVHLRQDLERVRNLCYMVNRREKIKRQYYRMRENVFFTQIKLLMDDRLPMTSREIDRIINRYHHSSIYDSGWTMVRNEMSSCEDSVSVVKTEVQTKTSRSHRGFRRKMKSINGMMRKKKESKFRDESKQRNCEDTVATRKLKEENCVKTASSGQGSLSLNISKLLESPNSETERILTKVEEPLEIPACSSSTERSRLNDCNNKVVKTLCDSQKQNGVVSEKRKDNIHTRRMRHRTSSCEEAESSRTPAGSTASSNKCATVKEKVGLLQKTPIKQNGSRISEKLKAELNGLLQKSKLVVDEKVREKVQTKLLQSTKFRRSLMNGLRNRSQNTLQKEAVDQIGVKRPTRSESDGLLTANADRGCVPNGITSPGHQACSQNSWFGAVASPRGSLTGYKIPRRTTAGDSKASTQAENRMDTAGERLNDYHGSSSKGVVESRRVRKKLDTSTDLYEMDSPVNTSNSDVSCHVGSDKNKAASNSHVHGDAKCHLAEILHEPSDGCSAQPEGKMRRITRSHTIDGAEIDSNDSKSTSAKYFRKLKTGETGTKQCSVAS